MSNIAMDYRAILTPSKWTLMKLSLKFLLPLFILPMFILGCGDDDDKLDLSSNRVSVYLWGSCDVKINSGYGDYTVKSSDSLIATARIERDNVIITGERKGMAVIAVSDKSSKVVTIAVEVAAVPRIYWTKYSYITEGETIVLNLDRPPLVEYLLTNSDSTIAEAILSDNTIIEETLLDPSITIKGLKPGVATLTLIDQDRKYLEMFEITVSNRK